MLKITFLFLFSATIATAQDLTLTSGSSLSINDGGSLYINGAELQPSTNYDLQGPNEVTSFETPISSPQSIKKVIMWTNPVESYSGMVHFYYDNQDLNEIEEADLGLMIKDLNEEWILLDSNLNEQVKKMTFNFSNPTHITAITATSKQSLSSSEIREADIQVFPNPTTSTVTIAYDKAINVQVFNMLGSSILKTSSNNIDLSSLSTGTYVLQIMDQQTGGSIYKKIIKN
ncbi:hypothetical protein AAU57_13875 [Nonlabens sp. YIK11]|uniref:T9SS type A sorting domain-containing protein n=1 Tax=Nonlabens sp. YIK11 TaxID=1453349 RepID=UPI0006DC2A39|nr:T9SS type A sorting domain-containing protein [Nonlabens sp. YIK11]KQC34305.1 hypothetical protein AAU57_13875 [Nonlabens sp. YIK11]